MAEALEAAEVAAAVAQAERPGTFSELWAGLINAEPAVSGAQNLADKMQRDAVALRERYGVLVASPTATDAAGWAFVRDALTAAGGAEAVAEVGYLATPLGAVKETAKGTAADLGALVDRAKDAAKAAVSWGRWVVPLALVAVVVLKGPALVRAAKGE